MKTIKDREKKQNLEFLDHYYNTFDHNQNDFNSYNFNFYHNPFFDNSSNQFELKSFKKRDKHYINKNLNIYSYMNLKDSDSIKTVNNDLNFRNEIDNHLKKIKNNIIYKNNPLITKLNDKYNINQQKSNFYFEIKRKILHVLLGLLIVFFFQIGLLTPFFLFLLILLTVLVSYSYLKFDLKLPLFNFFIKHFERDSLKNKFPLRALFSYLLGSLLSIELFPTKLAYASIIILAFGDSISNLIGNYFKLKQSYDKFRNQQRIKDYNLLSNEKLIVGSILGFGAAFFAALFYISPIKSFVASFSAMLVEYYEIDLNHKPLDDNILIPLSAGTAVIILKKIFVFLF